MLSYKYEDQNSTPEPTERLGMVIQASYDGTGYVWVIQASYSGIGRVL